MENLINAIKDWPVILQSALGSGLFWFALIIGQKLTELISTKIFKFSKNKKYSDLFNQILRFQALKTGTDPLGGSYASILWLRASRHLIKGLIWLALGLISNAIAPIIGIVGFVGCLYYLFSALNIVKHLYYDGDIDKKIKELKEKLKEYNETS